MPALRAFAASVLSRGAGWTNELTCTTKGGQCVPAEISASVFEMGGRRCLLALVRDITERKRAEDALREAHAELARRVAELQELERRMADRTAELEAFSYSVSHDLRTPLRAIEGFSRMLQREHGAALGAEGRRLVNVIANNAHTRFGVNSYLVKPLDFDRYVACVCEAARYWLLCNEPPVR